MALPGIDARDIDVQVTRDDVLIKAESSRENKGEKGTVCLSEFGRDRVCQLVCFPEKIDPDTTKAEYKNGMLRMTASIAEAATKSAEVEAA